MHLQEHKSPGRDRTTSSGAHLLKPQCDRIARKRRHAQRARRQACRSDLARRDRRRRRRRRRCRVTARRSWRRVVRREGARRCAETAIRRGAIRRGAGGRAGGAVLARDRQHRRGGLVVLESVHAVAHILVDHHGHAFFAVPDLATVDPDGFCVVDLWGV